MKQRDRIKKTSHASVISYFLRAGRDNCCTSTDTFSSSVRNDYCNVGKNYRSKKCDPSIRARQNNGEDETSGPHHHRNEIFTSARRLIYREWFPNIRYRSRNRFGRFLWNCTHRRTVCGQAENFAPTSVLLFGYAVVTGKFLL